MQNVILLWVNKIYTEAFEHEEIHDAYMMIMLTNG